MTDVLGDQQMTIPISSAVNSSENNTRIKSENEESVVNLEVVENKAEEIKQAK